MRFKYFAHYVLSRIRFTQAASRSDALSLIFTWMLERGVPLLKVHILIQCVELMRILVFILASRHFDYDIEIFRAISSTNTGYGNADHEFDFMLRGFYYSGFLFSQARFTSAHMTFLDARRATRRQMLCVDIELNDDAERADDAGIA